MKKLFIALLVAGSIAGAATLAACTPANSGNAGSGNGKFDDITTTSSIFAFSAASAGMIISSEGYTAGSAPAGRSASAAAVTLNEASDGEDFSDLDKYMALVDSLLSDGGYNITEGASDREGYEHMTSITYNDVHGASHSYEMYYNLTEVIHFDDHDDDDWDDRDDHDENEEQYSIEGVMVIGGEDFAISGAREIESERDESQSQTKLYVNLGEGDYMLVEQDYETEDGETEQEYSYSVYRDGTCVERSSFEYENERDETEIKMTAAKDGQSESFYFTRESVRGEEIIVLTTRSGKDSQSYYVTPATDENGNVTYQYTPITR